MTMTRILRAGRWAAFVAAYALALNVMLTSVLLASVSPVELNALHQLCLNGVAKTQTSDKSDSGNPIVKCPLCVSSAAAALDAPAQSPAIAIRIALHVPLEALRHDIALPQRAAGDHHARGPPHLS